MMTLSNFRRIEVALVAIGLLALPCGTAAGRDLRTDNCEADVIALEAPRVRAILEEAEAAERGRGQPIDPERAALLYCEAASYGSLEAQYRLGRMVLDGRGVRRDVSIAATLFSIASDNGHQAARSMLLVTGEREPKLPKCLSDFQSGRKPHQAQEMQQFILKLVTQLGPRGR